MPSAFAATATDNPSSSRSSAMRSPGRADATFVGMTLLCFMVIFFVKCKCALYKREALCESRRMSEIITTNWDGLDCGGGLSAFFRARQLNGAWEICASAELSRSGKTAGSPMACVADGTTAARALRPGDPPASSWGPDGSQRSRTSAWRTFAASATSIASSIVTATCGITSVATARRRSPCGASSAPRSSWLVPTGRPSWVRPPPGSRR